MSDKIDQIFDLLEKVFTELQDTKTTLQGDITSIRSDIKKIDITLENDIKPDIKTLYELQVNINNKLEEVLNGSYQ